jgi:hypothetical protein
MAQTYAEILKEAMEAVMATEEPDSLPLLKRLKKRVPFSYEHLRKIMRGEPVVSEECNLALCKALNLDVKAMWELAQVEKLRKRNPHLATLTVLEPDESLRDVWTKLTREQRQQIAAIARGMLLQNELQNENGK